MINYCSKIIREKLEKIAFLLDAIEGKFLKDCVFCKIIAGESKSNLVHANEGAIAIISNNPEVAGHMLVFAKKYFATLDSVDKSSWYYIGEMLKSLDRRLKVEGYDGYNLLSANGIATGQSVQHSHLHVISRKMMGIDAWPTFKKDSAIHLLFMKKSNFKLNSEITLSILVISYRFT